MFQCSKKKVLIEKYSEVKEGWGVYHPTLFIYNKLFN